MMWSEISAMVALGLAGSFGHCVGMCGGFALAIGRDAGGRGALAVRHLAYQAGKALTYVFLAVLVTAGFRVLAPEGGFTMVQSVLSLLAGLVMLFYGAMQVSEWRPSPRVLRVLEPFPGCRALAIVAQRPGVLPAFFTGWMNGFLPCGLVLAMLVQLATTHSVITAAVGAAAFGFATFPGLFALGLVAQAWRPSWRRVFVRLTGLLLVGFGLVTITRAFPAGRHWLHETIIPGTWHQVREWCGF